MAGRYVDGNWEEDYVQSQLGQTVNMNGRDWINFGLRPEDMTRPELTNRLGGLNYNPQTDYMFDSASNRHLVSPNIANALNSMAPALAAQDKNRGGLTGAIKGFLDNGGGVMAMGLGGMGAALGGAFPGLDTLTGSSIPAGQTSIFSQLGMQNPFSNFTGGGDSGVELTGADDFTGGGNIFGDTYLENNTSFGGPTGLDLEIEGLGESAKQGFGGSGFGANQNGGTLFGAANAAAGAGGGFWDGLQKLAKGLFQGTGSNADKIGGGLLSNLLPGIFSGLGKYFAGKELTEGLNSAADRADPFASQRPFYQGQLKDMVTNPNWTQQNPMFQNLLNPAIRETMAASSARGDSAGGNMLHDVTKTGVETGAKFYLPMLQQMGALAGGNFQPSWAGSIAAQGANTNMQNTNDIMGDIMMGLQPMNTALFGRNEKQGNEKPNIINGGSGGGPNVMAQLGLS